MFPLDKSDDDYLFMNSFPLNLTVSIPFLRVTCTQCDALSSIGQVTAVRFRSGDQSAH